MATVLLRADNLLSTPTLLCSVHQFREKNITEKRFTNRVTCCVFALCRHASVADTNLDYGFDPCFLT